MLVDLVEYRRDVIHVEYDLTAIKPIFHHSNHFLLCIAVPVVSFPLRVSTQSPGFSNPSSPAGISRDQLLKNEIHRKKTIAPTSKACKFSMNSSPSAARRASFAASVFLLRRQRRVRVSRAVIMKQPSVARISFSERKERKERWDVHNARWICRLCKYRGAHLD